jgi:hypothetical protein
MAPATQWVSTDERVMCMSKVDHLLLVVGYGQVSSFSRDAGFFGLFVLIQNPPWCGALSASEFQDRRNIFDDVSVGPLVTWTGVAPALFDQTRKAGGGQTTSEHSH